MGLFSNSTFIMIIIPFTHSYSITHLRFTFIVNLGFKPIKIHVQKQFFKLLHIHKVCLQYHSVDKVCIQYAFYWCAFIPLGTIATY